MRGSRKYKAARALLFVIIFVCLFQIGRIQMLSVEHKKEEESIRGALYDGEAVSEHERGSETLETSEMLTRLYEENRDLVGWICIEGTKIDYPVMQCADDEYYLSHSFYGQESKYGCLYVRARADVATPGTNFIIYGHNMKDGAMFGELDSYARDEFCREHPKISFHTLSEERIYEVMAVFRTQIDEAEGGFEYYRFYQADTEAEFADFYENVKKLSLYDTGVEASFGDTFLTLSTCDYHVDDGRFVVVAKRL